MAQLPPKVPSMTQNWLSSFPFEMMSLPSNSITTISEQTSWVDEFFDFSAARRSSYRRPASDPIAFVEAPYIEECHNSNGPLVSCNNNGFERLDDEQVRSMFSDDVVAAAAGGSTKSCSKLSSTNPSTPSDQNSENDEKTPPHDHQHVHVQPKNEPGEVDSSGKPHMQMQMENPAKAATDTIVDPKRIKRILANRQSAQRSRVRKLQYVSELERSVTTLQNEVSALSPRVAFLDHQRLLLNVDNSALKQRIAALAQDKIFKDAHQEALKKEIERLRQIYHEQNLKKMANEASNEAPTPTPPPPAFNKIGCTDEQ